MLLVIILGSNSQTSNLLPIWWICKVKQPIFFIALLFCLTLNNSCAPVSQKQYEKNDQLPLTSTQITKKIVDRNIHLESIDFDAFVLFHENMKITATTLDGDTDSGTWVVLDENLLCLKFRSWYFGDNRCYRVIEDNNHLIFFTPNGALSYTATTISIPNNDIKQSASKDPLRPSIQKNNRQPEQTSSETAKERFIKLARNCPDCNFSGVDLSGAQLNHANLAGADLSGADLTNANLRQANLTGANLSGAKLIRANLPGANLSSADLTNADLSGSNLIRANVTGATTTNTNLTGAHLESIQGTIQ